MRVRDFVAGKKVLLMFGPTASSDYCCTLAFPPTCAVQWLRPALPLAVRRTIQLMDALPPSISVRLRSLRPLSKEGRGY